MPRAWSLLVALCAAAACARAAELAGGLAPAPSSAAGDVTESLDVCVVGAGPTGIAAAVALSRHNRTVAVLERQAGVGGQANASYVDPASGFRLHMGAVITGSEEETRVLGFAKELGIGIQARGCVVCRCELQ
jgi:glycine/D-amino acid oxidase-like deaminating enzyme